MITLVKTGLYRDIIHLTPPSLPHLSFRSLT